MMMHLMHAQNLTHGHFSRRFFPAFGEFFALKIEYIELYVVPSEKNKVDIIKIYYGWNSSSGIHFFSYFMITVKTKI